MRSKVLERLFHLSPLFGSMVILSMNVSSSPSSHPFLEKALETPLSDTFVFHPSDHDDRSARLLTIARLPNLTHLESSQVIAPPPKKKETFFFKEYQLGFSLLSHPSHLKTLWLVGISFVDQFSWTNRSRSLLLVSDPKGIQPIKLRTPFKIQWTPQSFSPLPSPPVFFLSFFF